MGTETYINFFFNFLSDYKKEVGFSNFPLLKKVGYVDIEDVFKKGIDDFKKRLEGEVTFKENKTILNESLNEFQIVKFEKSLNPKDYLTEGTPPKILTSVLTESMDLKGLIFRRKMEGFGGFSRSSGNYNIVVSEGDTINIKSKRSSEELITPISRSNVQEIFSKKLSNFVFSNTNYNFTFLIELDPL